MNVQILCIRVYEIVLRGLLCLLYKFFPTAPLCLVSWVYCTS